MKMPKNLNTESRPAIGTRPVQTFVVQARIQNAPFRYRVGAQDEREAETFLKEHIGEKHKCRTCHLEKREELQLPDGAIQFEC